MASSSSFDGPFVLLRKAWTIFKAGWKPALSIAGLPYVLMYVGNVVYSKEVSAAIASSGAIVWFPIGFLCSLSGIILMIAAYPALADAVARLDNGSAPISFGGEYKVGFKHFWSFILVIIIVALSSLSAYVLLVIPGLIVSVYIGFYIFALVVDGKKGFSALTESFATVKGHWWGTFGRSVFISIVAGLVLIVTSGLAFVLQALLGAPAGTAAGTTIGLTCSFLGSVAILPLTMAYAYRMYASLKSLRQPDAKTAVFKRWLVAFICLSVALVILAPLLAGAFFFKLASDSKPGLYQSAYPQASTTYR